MSDNEFEPGKDMYSVHFSLESNDTRDFGTWDDANGIYMIPAERPVVPPPEVRTNFVEIPGRDGSLDISEVIGDKITYGDREGSFNFIVLNPRLSVLHPADGQEKSDRSSEWLDVYSFLMTNLHGQKGRMILAEDDEYYYYGRFFIDKWTSGKEYSEVTVRFKLEPFKYELSDTKRERGVF